MFAGYIKPEEFLPNQTAEGLGVTLNSTIDLSKYLLESCSFTYVLAGKMCQDPFEVKYYEKTFKINLNRSISKTGILF